MHEGRAKLQVPGRSTCGERSYGHRGKEAKTRQAKHIKAKREMKYGGNKKGVARVEVTNPGRTGVAQKRH